MKEDGFVKWFGENWGAPMCFDLEHVDTPVGDICIYHRCGLPIAECDQGVRMAGWGIGVNGYVSLHLDCHIEQVLGPSELRKAVESP